MYVVHTFYLPAGRKRPVVHAYGYPTKSKAQTERKRMLRGSAWRIERERAAGAIINISVTRLFEEDE